MNRKVVIFDIDNCLSDDSWRIRLINWQEPDLQLRYHAYHCGLVLDKPANLHVLEQWAECRIALLTACPVRYRALREAWLREHGVRFDWLLMRNNNDHRKSVAVKRTQYLWLTSGEYDGVTSADVIAAYDDREDVLDMYRFVGVPHVHLLKIHDTDAYAAPANVAAVQR